MTTTTCWACGAPTEHYVRMLGRYVCDECSVVDRERGVLKGSENGRSDDV